MRQNIVMQSILLLSLIALNGSLAGAKAVLSASEVEPFLDSHLPRDDLEGQQEFPYLGRITKLNTVLSPLDVSKISTKFSFFRRETRQSGSLNITFQLPSSKKKGELNETSTIARYNFDSADLLAKSNFDPDLRTIVVIAGFLSKDHTPWMHDIKDLWLDIEDVNVILVSWASSNRYIYSKAVANTPFVARQISIILYYLAELNGRKLSEDTFGRNFHFFGHSLGAHISGFVGKDLGGKLGRITGMDPAGPSFDTMDEKLRLNPNDARLVDAIHTNMGRMRYLNAFSSGAVRIFDMITSKIPYLRDYAKAVGDEYTGEGNTAWFGIEANVGHVDYFANNGKTQPGCTGLMHVCDHGRASELVIDILNYEKILIRSRPKGRDLKARLLAFESRDARDFAAGLNNCDLSVDSCGFNISSLPDDAHLPQLKESAIPIDLITPVEEFRDELKDLHQVQFPPRNGSSDPNATIPRYFFKTREREPFVGDHYLLRLYLDTEATWSNDCALHASIVDERKQRSTVKLNKAFKMFDTSGAYNGIAMPFVHPSGPEARVNLDKLLELLDKMALEAAQLGKNIELNEEQKASMSRLIPQFVHLNVTRAETTGIFETISGKVPNPFRKIKCELMVNQVKIEPIILTDHRLIAQYKQTEVNEVEESEYESRDIRIEEFKENEKGPVGPTRNLTLNSQSNMEIDRVLIGRYHTSV